MQPIRTVPQICEQMLALETELDLLRRPIAGVKVWQLLRMELYYAIAQATGVFTTPHGNPTGVRDVLRGAPTLVKMWTKSPLRGRYTRETLVFDHGRKVLVDGEHVDIYTHHLLESLEPGSYDVLESFHQGSHATPEAAQRRYLDLLTVGSALASRLRPFAFTPAEAAFIAELEAQIVARFGVRVPLAKRFRHEILHFRFAFAFYRRLLRKRRPRRIYLVVSYSFYKRPLIAAAKAEGVETIEIQHGTLSPYHLGYHFPHVHGELDYFPSRLLTFGTFWNTAASFPLPPERVEAWGYPHFSHQRERFKDVARKPGQVLFLSQGAIGERLAEFALASARRLPDHRLVYKLHPGEYQRWRQDYPALVEAAALPNVEVIDHNTRQLYAWMAESEYQVGVFSTAIYEGLAFGCKTCVVELPGVEYMQRLIDAGQVTKVDSADALVASLGDTTRGAALDPEAIFKTR